MKNLIRIVFGVALVGLLAACASKPVKPEYVQTTPENLAKDVMDLIKKIETTGKGIVGFEGGNVRCACVPTVVPNGPPPPPPGDREAFKRAMKTLEAVEMAYAASEVVTYKAAPAGY